MTDGGSTLGTAQIPVRATLDKLDSDLKGLQGKLESSLKGISSKVSATLGKALKVGLVGAGAVVAGATAALATTIDPASDLEETVTKVGVVFDDQAERVMAFGETAAKALGMTKQEALAAAGTYGNLFRAMEISEDTSADMSLGLVQLAADLASFNNIDPAVALDKLRAGLTGETEPLKSLGVNINQALLQQKALDMGLWDGVGYLDAAAKAQASYALIMEQTTLAQGDFARTSDGLANQQRINAALFGDMKAKIGTAVLPAVTAMQQALGRLVQSDKFQRFLEGAVGWLEVASTKLEPVAEGIGTIGEAVGRLFSGDVSGFTTLLAEGLYTVTDALGIGREAVQPWIDGFTELTQTIGGFVTEQLIPFVSEHAEAFKAALIGIGAVLAAATIAGGIASIVAGIASIVAALNPVTLIIAGIAVAVGLLAAAWAEDWGGIRTWMTDVWTNTLQPVFQAIWSFIEENIIPVLSALGELWLALVVTEFEILSGLITEAVVPALTAAWEWLQKTAAIVADKLSPALTWLKEHLLDPLGQSLGTVSELFQKITDKIKKFTDGVKDIQLPDWLTPGSPTPFELGLRGISSAMGQLTRVQMPAFEAALTQRELVEVALGAGAGGGSNTTYNQQRYDMPVTVMGGTVSQVRRGVLDALRMRGVR